MAKYLWNNLAILSLWLLHFVTGEDASSESSDAAKQWEAAIRQALMPVQTPGLSGIQPTIKAEKENQAVTPDPRYENI